MPLLGYFLGVSFADFVSDVDHWIAFILLGIIGGNMIKESFAGVPCTVISEAADYIFPAEAFYDSRYHMNSEGAKLRTNQLIADLDAYGLGR